MKKIIDYLFYRYYLISIKNEEFPRFGATCILAEIIMMAYLFAVLILSFLLTRDFFLPNTSGRARIIIGIIGSFLPWIVIYLHYNKKRINALLEKYQNNRYNTKYSDKAVLSLSYIVPTVGLILMLLLYQFR
ncbi:sodium transporter [Bacteroides stercoris]|uniref:Sodium transporter n=1 Tax=Bacteroides stercoris TaxID=46506 RepID=A0A7J5LLR9_BACSE|nr:sodium transporter [Bacteroides stercoris]KAB5317832.1 sodium transporter [Bacteroides stercoris]KAB5326954.1 sodium transporter [Bacteroides stercoris]KAB5333731.1 sodium transporter [Bacteroides stercoris]KAB5333814.1 sodium transporter [Bacteroides stercoris]